MQETRITSLPQQFCLNRFDILPMNSTFQLLHAPQDGCKDVKTETGLFARMCVVKKHNISAYFIPKNVQSILTKFAETDILNANETSLFWKDLLLMTLYIIGMKCSSGKFSKETITVLFEIPQHERN